MARIEKIKAQTILDSRGQWTLEAKIFSDTGLEAVAGVPQGKSRGKGEAVSREAEEAVSNVNDKINQALKDFSLDNQEGIDNRLKELDGSEDKSNLGGNAILAISLASARLMAKVDNKPLWLYLSQLTGSHPQAPKLLANLINGGLHAQSGLDFQEYILIPETNNIKEAIEIILKVYNNLGQLLKTYPSGTAVGDEGGYAPSLDDNNYPFELIKKALSRSEIKFSFGLDAAADNIADLTEEELFEAYSQMIDNFPLTYLEDPFGEGDFSAWRRVFSEFSNKVDIVGDDLTVTNPKLLSKPEMKEMINGVIIKPNQIGTLSETLEAIKIAKQNNWRIFVSHRSGETNDDFIADLAFGVGADGFKLGAPARGERISKYNRLLKINVEKDILNN
ncbi:MAG TPA: phosphopyruvate hydratase [Candidatus Vogelbacteria bacterium]|nr:phosphopyruvate hydratase [Candidatus Vogelbacteria bacterium]